MKILVIAPHPDDEVLGCGGTISRYAIAGDEVYLCIVTKTYSPEWPEEELKKRKEAVLTVNHILGIKKTFFLDYPTVKLDTIPQVEINNAISKIVETIKPVVVLLPHKGDLSRDHRIVFDASLVAVRPKPGTNVRRVVSYETPSGTEWGSPSPENAFVPNIFIDITSTLETKLRAMSEYRLEIKEFPHPRSLETISALAKLRGSTIGVTAAEAFMLIREAII